jgi:hypothetical protein
MKQTFIHMASNREAGGGNTKFETIMHKLCHFLQMRSSGWDEETDPAHKVSEFPTRMERRYHYVGTTVRRSSSHCPGTSLSLILAISESGVKHLLWTSVISGSRLD